MICLVFGFLGNTIQVFYSMDRHNNRSASDTFLSEKKTTSYGVIAEVIEGIMKSN